MVSDSYVFGTLNRYFREYRGRRTMDRLTIPDEPIEGGTRRAVIDARAVKEQAMTLYWKLKRYEDTGLEPEEILTGVQLAEIACLQIRYKKRQELLERAVRCIEGCYGRETELSEAIKKEIN